MRQTLLAALAVGCLSLASTADAASGSGTISFDFTNFSGAFGAAPAATVNDQSTWGLVGAVNGVIPTVNGVTTPVPGTDQVYVGGTTSLSGQSVSMVYSNIPTAVESIVSFTPAAGGFSNVVTGQDFVIGTLSFTNGQWVGGSGNPATNFPVTLDFTLSTASSTAAFNQTIHDSITVVTNQSNSDDCSDPQVQQDEADFVYITGGSAMGSMRVYDAACRPSGVPNSGSVNLVMHFGSLDYVKFDNPTGGAFIADSVGVGSLGGGVPEPAAWALLILGFGAVGGLQRRRHSLSRAVPVHA